MRWQTKKADKKYFLEKWLPRIVLAVCAMGFLYGNIAGIILNENYTFDKWFNAIYILGSFAFYLFWKECFIWYRAFEKVYLYSKSFIRNK